MQNLYPLFERNRVLKKELLWSLRDYSFQHIELEYQEYGEGILRGCEIRIQDKELIVGKGMVKHQGFIYLITEELAVPYESTGELEVLKFKMKTDRSSQDYISYGITLFLDHNPVKSGDELEVCRFKLRQGSVLRNQYKDFDDMTTGFDTVDVTEADWSGLAGKTLSPAVTDYYAQLVLAESGSRPEDINFAYLCLNQPGAVRRSIIEHYVSAKPGLEGAASCQNGELYGRLGKILLGIRSNRQKSDDKQMKRRQILVE